MIQFERSARLSLWSQNPGPLAQSRRNLARRPQPFCRQHALFRAQRESTDLLEMKAGYAGD